MTSDEQLYRMTIEREKFDDDPKHIELTVSSTLAEDSEDRAAISDALWPTIRRDQSALLAMLADALRPWIEYERQEHGCGGPRTWELPRPGALDPAGVWVENDDPIPPDRWEPRPSSYDVDVCSIGFTGNYDGLPATAFTVPRNRERDWCTRISAALAGIARNLDAS